MRSRKRTAIFSSGFFPRVFSIVASLGIRADDIFPILFPFTSMGEIPLFSGKNGIKLIMKILFSIESTV